MPFRGKERRQVPTRLAVIVSVAVASASCSVEDQSTPTAEIFPTQSRVTEFVPAPTEKVLTEVGVAQDRTEWPSGWYKTASQEKMDAYTEFATRLYQVNNSGQREPISLDRIDTNDFYSDTTDLNYFLPTLYGIVLDDPKLENLRVVDYVGNESMLGIYTVPYMIQTSSGEYIVKDIILGAESQSIIGFGNARVNVLPEGGPSRFESISVQEVVSRLEADKQYPMMLRIWENEEKERIFVENSSDNKYLVDLFVVHRTFGRETDDFINALLSGSDLKAYEDLKYLSHLGQIIFNLDN